jgi:hypothetical protein
LAPALDKDYIKTQEVLSSAYAKVVPIEKFNATQKSDPLNNTQPRNTLFGRGYHFHDSENIIFNSLDLFYTRQKVTDDLGFSGDGGYFYIEQQNKAKYAGTRYGISLLWNHFILRLGLNYFDGFTQFVPTLKYENRYRQHSYSLEYTYQNALFYTFSLCPYEQRINVHHLSASDYINLKNNKDLWTNIELNNYINDDTELTGQFDWRFYYYNQADKKFSYHTALEGWYTTHTKPNSCFYSPNFSDTTLLRIDPQYILNKYIGIKGKAGLGYSFADNTQAYKLGLWFFGTPQENLSYSIGCLYSNSTRISASSSYNYHECEVNLEYQW